MANDMDGSRHALLLQDGHDIVREVGHRHRAVGDGGRRAVATGIGDDDARGFVQSILHGPDRGAVSQQPVQQDDDGPGFLSGDLVTDTDKLILREAGGCH